MFFASREHTLGLAQRLTEITAGAERLRQFKTFYSSERLPSRAAFFWVCFFSPLHTARLLNLGEMQWIPLSSEMPQI